MRGRN